VQRGDEEQLGPLLHVDVGSGHGAMLGAMHQLWPSVRLRGVEADAALVEASRVNLTSMNAIALIEHRSVGSMRTLGDDVTLAFAWCCGLHPPAESLVALLDAYQRTPSLRRVCFVHKATANQALKAHVLELERVDTGTITRLSVSLTGSGESFTAWVIDVDACRRRFLLVPSGAARPAAPSTSSQPSTRSRSRASAPAHPSKGDWLRVSGDERVHVVEQVEMQTVRREQTAVFHLSGLLRPTKLWPSAGGTKWEPVRPVLPATRLDAARLQTRVINLDRRADRLQRLRHRVLHPHAQWMHWKRSAAVDGRTLMWSALVADRVVAPKAAADAQLGIPTICGATGSFSPHLTLGAVGCALSHRVVWQELLHSGDNCALVLEDDVDEVCEDLFDALVDLLRRGVLPTHWQICYLGSHEHPAAVDAASKLVKPTGARVRVHEIDRHATMTGTFAYLVNRSGARHLLDSNLFPLHEQWDVAVGSAVDWSPGTRFSIALDQPLATALKSEAHGGDTDVQVVGADGVRAHATLPPGLAQQLLPGGHPAPAPSKKRRLSAPSTLSGERQVFNRHVLALQRATHRHRWSEHGTMRLALGVTHARALGTYLVDPSRRDANGHLLLDDGSGTALRGYSNYRATHQVEGGRTHAAAEQGKHTIVIDDVDRARGGLPGLDALVESVHRQLPPHETHDLLPLHAHLLNQTSQTARFADHQDTEEEVAPGRRKPDRRIVYTAVLMLSDGVDSSMRVLGEEAVVFEGSGSGFLFPSQLWHRTERAQAGVWKLAIFFGYWLPQQR